MPLVYDYRTGDVIDTETGEVVDRIYYDEQMTFHDHYETAERRHHDVLVPSVGLRGSLKSKYSRAKSVLSSILGRPLTAKERARLARWLAASNRLAANKRNELWLYTTVYMFLTDINLDPNPYVPPKAALLASTVTRPNRYVMVLKKVSEALQSLGRQHLWPVASDLARVLMDRYGAEISGKHAAMIAGIAVYASSAMTEEDPVAKKAVAKVLGVSHIRHRFALKVISSPFTIVAERPLCEAVARRTRLHPRVVCVEDIARAELGLEEGDGKEQG